MGATRESTLKLIIERIAKSQADIQKYERAIERTMVKNEGEKSEFSDMMVVMMNRAQKRLDTLCKTKQIIDGQIKEEARIESEKYAKARAAALARMQL